MKLGGPSRCANTDEGLDRTPDIGRRTIVTESLQHRSSLSLGGINAMSWIGRDGTRHHRVVLEVRGVMVMPIDAAGTSRGYCGTRSGTPRTRKSAGLPPIGLGTWTRTGRVTECRVVVEIRGMLVMTLTTPTASLVRNAERV